MRWENGNEKTAWSRKYLEQELLEVSAVGIPANPNALILALKAGAVSENDLHDLRRLLSTVAADVRRFTASKRLGAAFMDDNTKNFSPRIATRSGKRTIVL